MKKSITVLHVLLAMLVLHNVSQAQVDEGQIDLNLGIGFVTFGATGDVGFPPFSISGDYAIKDNITVGALVGYYSSSEEIPSFGGTYTFNYTYTIFGVRGTYHLELIDNVDTYGGLLLGYNAASSSVEAPDGANPNFTPPAAEVGGVALGAFIGGRYHFTDNLGAFLELGYGISALNLGLTYKID